MHDSSEACDRQRNCHGFALFIVLWFLVLIAALGTYLLANGRTETALARNVLANAHAEALADAGIAQTIFNLTDPMPERRWDLDGDAHPVRLPGGEISIRLGDETMKINPNLAAPHLIAGLFEAVGVERPQALLLGAAIADWAHPLPKTAKPGADLAPYLAAGLDYGPPHRPMENLDEMRLVLGMTPEFFAASEPYLSIYTASDAPDAVTAPAIIRRAMALASDKNSLQAAIATATTSAASPPVTASAGAPSVVDVEVTARSSDGGVFVRRAIVSLDPDSPKGYQLLAWRLGALAP